MESLLTLAITGTECIANRQTFFFIYIDIGNLANYPLLINIGGLFGTVIALITWYACAATIVHVTFEKQIVPLVVYV